MSDYYIPPPPPPPPILWNTANNDPNANANTHVNLNAPGPNAPNVPNYNTVVDTDVLNTFADNINTLITPLPNLQSGLKTMNVQPGDFYHADLIRNAITGLNGGGGLAIAYHGVIGDLINGLTDVHQAVKDMAVKYSTTEDLNNASVNDLSTEFQGAQGYFNALPTDAQPPATQGG